MTTNPLPDFDHLWDYDRPHETEQAFRAILPTAREAGDLAYTVELLTQIARTQGLQRQFEAAHHTLDEAEALLSDDFVQPRIRYVLERGRVYNSSGQPMRARAFFVQAWDLAMAQRVDFYAVDAAHMLAIVEQAEAQMEWNLRALNLAERSPDSRAQGWRGSLYNNIGWSYHDRGQYDDALTFFLKAFDWRKAHGSAPEVRVAQWCVARTLRSLGHVADALSMQRELLAQAEAAGEPDGYIHEELGECLLILGHNGDAQQHFARAYALLSQDIWLVANEAPRLQRLKDLAGVEFSMCMAHSRPREGLRE